MRRRGSSGSPSGPRRGCGWITRSSTPSPFDGDPAAAPQPLRPEPGLVDLALRCGRVFGLDIYGVDAIETADGVAVLEVNEFPNFTAVPDAAGEIADFILARADTWDVMPVGTRAHSGVFAF
ncbi:MAG: hypothetical protein DMD69_16475 [Gemmatimonadetes bacterium]|nr:MAG: hypothetical protein DMD69_16475 [Gemmatimonadota bacterium]